MGGGGGALSDGQGSQWDHRKGGTEGGVMDRLANGLAAGAGGGRGKHRVGRWAGLKGLRVLGGG